MRPSTGITGASSKNFEKRSVSSVAELTITLRSARSGQDALEPAEQEVDGQAALVRLVDDERVVAVEERVALNLGEQDAVGHELDLRLLARAILEADLVADLAPELALELARDASRHAGRGDATRLGHADLSLASAPRGQGDFRQLRRLPRTGRPDDDHHLVLEQRPLDFVDAGADGQLARKANRRAGPWLL